MRLFHKSEDYAAFERVLAEGLDRYPVDLLTYCVLPNHWHLVVRPRTNEALGRWMGWVGVTHVRRKIHEHYRSRGGGHLYQGRFKSFPVGERRPLLDPVSLRRSESSSRQLVTRAKSGRGGAFGNGRSEWPTCRWPTGRCVVRPIG